MRETWGAVAATSGTRVYSLVLGFATVALTARWLGAEGRGVLAAVQAWVGLFATVGHLSLGQVAVHRASKLRGTKWVPQVFGTLILAAGAATILGWIAATLLFPSGDHLGLQNVPARPLLVGFLILPCLIWDSYAGPLLAATGNIRTYNRAQAAARTAGFLLMLVLLASDLGVYAVLLALLVDQCICAWFGSRSLIRSEQRPAYPDLATITYFIRNGSKLHLNAIGAYLFSSADILILTHFRGAAETGQYQLAAQLIGFMLIVPQSAALVLYGTVARGGPNRAWPEHRRLLLWVLAGMVLASALAWAVAPFAIPLLAGPEFGPAVPVFRWLLLGVLGMTFSTLMAPQWIGRGMFLRAAALTLAVGAINFAANLTLVPRFGMYGAVVSSLGAYTIAVATNLWMVLHADRGVRADAA